MRGVRVILDPVVANGLTGLTSLTSSLETVGSPRARVERRGVGRRQEEGRRARCGRGCLLGRGREESGKFVESGSDLSFGDWSSS